MTILIDVLANDTDPEGDPLAVTAVSAATNGVATLEAGGIRYTPAQDFFGLETLTYEVSDQINPPVTETLEIEVLAFFDAPTVAGEQLTVNEDQVGQVNIANNDFDVDGSSLLWIVPNTTVQGGTLSEANGVVTYTPPADYFGPDSFTYDVTDNQTPPVNATVSITVLPIQDAPVVTSGAATVPEDAPVGTVVGTVLANDADGDPLTFSTTGGAGLFAISNTGDITVAAPLDSESQSQFTLNVEANDLIDNGSAPFVITVSDTDEPPVALGHQFQTLEDLNVPIDLTQWASDPEGAPLTFAIGTLPSNGTISQNGSMWTYQPDTDFAGADSFTYTATDPTGFVSNVATISVDILAVNDAPVAQDDAGALFTTLEDTQLTFNASDLTANDVDIDSPVDPLSVQLLANPTSNQIGTLAYDPITGDFTYVPATDFNGPFTFEYTITDSGSLVSVPAEVTIAVTPVNDAPNAVDDQLTVSLLPGSVAGSVFVLGNDQDVDGDPLSVSSFVDGTYGSANPAGNGTITYALNDLVGLATANFMDSFTYTVADGQGGQATATVDVAFNVTDDNDGVPISAGDICPFDFDPFQLDADGDGLGDVCDPTPGATLQRSPASALPATSGNSTAVAAGDINGDGFDDIVVGKAASRVFEVFVGDGLGGFTQVPQGLPATGVALSTNDVELGDLDNDGDLDLVTAHQNGNVRVYQNDGTGVFTAQGTQFTAPNAVANAIALGFVNGDGLLDIVVARENVGGSTAQVNRLHLNQGTTGGGSTIVFDSPGMPLGDERSTSVAIGDRNGDGLNDIHFARPNLLNTLWIGEPGGQFTELRIDTAGAGSAVVLLADVFGNGLDEPIFEAGGNSNTTVAVADADGDGDIDIFVTHPFTDNWRLFNNDGNGNFLSGLVAEGPEFSGARDIAVGDFDGDGTIDVVTVSSMGDDFVYLVG